MAAKIPLSNKYEFITKIAEVDAKQDIIVEKLDKLNSSLLLMDQAGIKELNNHIEELDSKVENTDTLNSINDSVLDLAEVLKSSTILALSKSLENIDDTLTEAIDNKNSINNQKIEQVSSINSVAMANNTAVKSRITYSGLITESIDNIVAKLKFTAKASNWKDETLFYQTATILQDEPLSWFSKLLEKYG